MSLLVMAAIALAARAPATAPSRIVEAQILLDRAHFSPGEIDGTTGINMRVALLGFQKQHKLKETGRLDPATWKALSEGSEPAFTQYTIAEEDVKGPFETIPADMMEQAKLTTLGYQSASEALGEKFHISPKLLERLNPGKDLSAAGAEIRVPSVIHAPLGHVAKVVVSKKLRTVSAFDGEGAVLAQYPATIGSEHDPLPLGDWKVTVVQQRPAFFYDPKLFWNAKAEDSKAKIAPGPNNPVGVVWIGLSKEHYGIHGTPEPGLIGHAQSHGCIRLANWDAEELSKAVKVGTSVILGE